MKKTELIARLAEETGLSQVATKSVVEHLVQTILKTVKKEKRFALSGLGVFHLVKRAKRTCRNPQTGEPIKVKSHNALTFKPSKSVKISFA
ncbi:MAG: HU family DNA-binding protein [Deltaproteobacteria bacterium]|jgi:DNA-binding protein HU-beta|nr:HU family DNA-binding protein [Deltaproteobacteria bacterium]MDR1298538.1 HU family DNA-binding protein [Deltaproteobacteria bacterium]